MEWRTNKCPNRTGCESSLKVNIPTIVEYRGVIVPSMGDRKGKRGINLKQTSSNWGSKRKKKVGIALDPWTHPDTAESKAAFISKAIKAKEEQKGKNFDVDLNDLEELSILKNS